MLNTCGGCKFCKFPYRAEVPVLVNGKRETRTFRNAEDVWNVVDLIVEETTEMNKKNNKNFDIVESIVSQIPFFSCSTHFFNWDVNNDIEKYVYCEKFNVPPHKGDFNDQPAKWVRRSFAIKTAIAKKEKKEMDVARKKHTNQIQGSRPR